MSPALGFGAYLPDVPDLDHPGVLKAENVVPGDNDSYGPFSSLAPATTALDARCQGAITVRDPSGTLHGFAGTATKLYHLTSVVPGVWVDVSRLAGGAYAAAAEEAWSFTQYGTLMIAGNGVDAPQSFTMGSSANFAALAASAPLGRIWATIRNFVFTGRVPGTSDQRIQWGPINNPAGTWGSVAATQADFQDLPDGGRVTGIQPAAGGAALVWSERAINLFTYEGTPTIFRRDEIARIGCVAEQSIARFGDTYFFVGEQGFYAVNGAGQITPIGSRKVNRSFLNLVSPSMYHRITAAVDPVSNIYVCAYPSNASGDGTPDSAFIYSWDLDRWSTAVFAAELLYGIIPGISYTLDGLDAVSASIDALAYPLDSRFWVGTGRLALGGFDTAHKAGAFAGPPLAATIDTRESQLLKGRRARVLSGRPLVDGGAVTVRVGTRNQQSGPVMFSPAVAPNIHGLCPTRAEGRYHRARLSIAAGGTWNHAMGFDELQVLPGAPR